MKKQTQADWVMDKLNKEGCITRNFALANYVSRLGAIICDLNKEGWVIEGSNLKTPRGLDYIYKVKKSPYEKVVYKVQDGREIITHKLAK